MTELSESSIVFLLLPYLIAILAVRPPTGIYDRNFAIDLADIRSPITVSSLCLLLYSNKLYLPLSEMLQVAARG
jgi:hypothetical protein